MKRSHIQQEKTPNNVNFMNHAVNDDGKTELINSLSQDFVNGDRESFYVARNLRLDSHEDSDHFYENLPRASKNKCKGKSLSGFVGNLKSMTRELRIRKYVRKNQVAMIENQSLDERNSSPPTTPIDQIGDRMNGEDCYSYTSCQEENIYENLNFTFQHNWSENESVCENEALKSWLEQLTFDTVDYETNEIMITKCIPSKHKNILCNFEASPTYVQLIGKAPVDPNANSTLEQYKLDILNKCFAAIWKQETETEVLNNLYVFLNDIFSSFFKRNATQVVTAKVGQTTTTEVKRRRKKSEKVDGYALCKTRDKETIQRLETFILSVTLNRLTISYDKCMKFYFALESCHTFGFLGAETSKIFKFVRVNQRFLKLKTRRDLRRFLNQLQLIFINRALALREEKQEVKSVERSDDELNSKVIVVEEENIYQPIWNWHSDSKSLDELDDNDWEIDSEFLFVGAKTQRNFSPYENMFNTVCILYSDDNPELNRILYQYKSSTNITNDKSEETSTTKTCDEKSLMITSDTTQKSESQTEFHEPDSVIAWKTLLRQPYYCEDEEDVIMSETQIASLTMLPPPDETSTPWLSNDDIRTETPKNKLITIANGSYELKSASETSIETSVVGNYRQVTDTDGISISSAASTEVIEEPKKDRERFRDKMKGKFKLKSSKPPPVITPEVEAVKEIEEEFFGSNLETVEKDSEHKLIPKIVVECVNALEMDANISTPGLYRVSGNKTVIEAFKKKSNEKKNAKKDTKITSLRNQDVHSVTGILKMFFRELTPPLMPSKTFVECTSDDVTFEQINSFLIQMPAKNYQTLKFLMAHLKRVEEQKEENLMNSGNLAICWGLCIFSSSFETLNSFFENDISKCNMLCKKMIDFYETIFKE